MTEHESEETVVEAPAHVVVPTRHEQAKAARSAKLWTWVARATGLALLAAVLGFGFYLAYANAGARTERVELIQQLDEERAKVDALYEQLRDLGEDPIVDKSDPTPGATGPSGPTGEQGIPGQDGRTPTAAEVLAAVNAYCATVNGCRGADGTNGTPGTNGTNGQPGTPGTNGESIVGPAGPAGADGAPGSPGADGVSVTGVSCVIRDDLSTAFRFTFSNGATADVTGACLP